MRSPALLCPLVLLLAGSAPALADWQVVRVSGSAVASSGGGPPVRLAKGTTVPDAVTIDTGSDGRVMLRRGTSQIIVSPQSSITLDDGLLGITTTVQQRIGHADFQVERRDVRYFSVETPTMAAVVKGTRFSVRVAGRKSNLAVKTGLVGVTDLASGESADVAPGQRAMTTGYGLSLSGRGAKPDVTVGRRQVARVVPMSARDLAAVVAAATPAEGTSPGASKAKGDGGKGKSGKDHGPDKASSDKGPPGHGHGSGEGGGPGAGHDGGKSGKGSGSDGGKGGKGGKS